MVAIPSRRRAQLIRDEPLRGAARPLITRRDLLRDDLALAQRKFHAVA